jgi:hypothetical protein
MTAMAPSDVALGRQATALDEVRALERSRIEAIRTNDVAAMSRILDPKFLYINSHGNIYDKRSYLRSVDTHQLTYAEDLELTESNHRVDGDLVIIAGEMLGHARLDGEPLVHHLRSMRVWRLRRSGWRLLAWQSTSRW